MGATTHSIEVNAPLRAVYNQWTQFEEFPRFMEGVEEVRQEGDKQLFWKAKIAGKVKEWEAEITSQVPDEKISWESVDGSPNAGTIAFEELGPDRTIVTATIEYEPEGFLEKTGDALGFPSGRVEGDLKRFRDYIEERGRETGGWRGQIEEGESPSLDPTQATRAEQGLRPESVAEVSRETESGSIEVPLSGEEVKVGKRKVSAGDIKVRKTVTTEQASPAPGGDIAATPVTDIEKSALKKEGAGFVTREQIQQRAYFIAGRRKSSNVAGDEKDDWAQAERELRKEATEK